MPNLSPSRSHTTRRAVLSSAPLLIVATAMPSAKQTPDDSDQGLIKICNRHLCNQAAFNDCSSDADDSPHWSSYEASLTAISDAEPHTFVGVAAKARAALAEATWPDGTMSLQGSIAENWALDILRDLVRLAGGAA